MLFNTYNKMQTFYKLIIKLPDIAYLYSRTERMSYIFTNSV